MSFKDVLSAGQFTRADLDLILSRAEEMAQIIDKGGSDIAKGKIMAGLFYEPSTRTRLSFETAMYRLGGQVISEMDKAKSSLTKGEDLSDTIRVIGGYADVLVIRTEEEGSAALAAKYSPVPVINGGDGAAEHPTQSLLDLFSIKQRFRLGEEKLVVSFVGDCKHSRCVHSLATMLRHFDGVEINFVAPENIQIPQTYLKTKDQISYEITDNVLASSDVIYTQRIQKERFEDPILAETLSEAFVFDVEKAQKMKESAIILDPLPRVKTIDFAVDDLSQAQYFKQAMNGVPVRMALLANALGV